MNRWLAGTIGAGVALGLILGIGLSGWARAQTVSQQPPPLSQEETIDVLRSMVDTYKTMTIEANERVAAFKAEVALATVRHKALQAELDKLKAEKAKPEDAQPAAKAP